MQAPGGFIALQDSRLGRIRGNWHVVALEFVFMNVCRARLQHERLEPFDAGMVRPRFFKRTVTTWAWHCSSCVGKMPSTLLLPPPLWIRAHESWAPGVAVGWGQIMRAELVTT